MTTVTGPLILLKLAQASSTEQVIWVPTHLTPTQMTMESVMVQMLFHQFVWQDPTRTQLEQAHSAQPSWSIIPKSPRFSRPTPYLVLHGNFPHRCQTGCSSTQPQVSSAVRRRNQWITRPTQFGRTRPTQHSRLKPHSGLRYWKTTTAMACLMSCPTTTLVLVLNLTCSLRTRTTTTTACPIPTRASSVQTHVILILTVTASVMVMELVMVRATLDLTLRRSTRPYRSTLTATLTLTKTPMALVDWLLMMTTITTDSLTRWRMIVSPTHSTLPVRPTTWTATEFVMPLTLIWTATV